MREFDAEGSGSAIRLRSYNFTNACKGWNQSWLVLIGRLSRDAARANVRSRRAPGLGRNHLSCKREYSRLQLRWFRPKPGVRRLLRCARAASRERRPISIQAKTDYNPCKAFVNPNFAAGSRIRNLLHQTPSLVADKDGRTDCWISCSSSADEKQKHD